MDELPDRFPDFLGIGATRGGSSWLYRVLSRHPDVWMPPVKELHFFDKPREGERSVGLSHRVLLLRIRDYLTGERRRSTGDSLGATLRWDYHYLFRRRSLAWYRGLFRPHEGQITGEVTPAYAILDEAVVRRIAAANPELKALYMLRNPIDRAWSSVVNSLARKQRRSITTVPDEQVLRKVDAMTRSRRSDYAANIRTWRAVLGEERLFIGYMEEIKNDPEELIGRICRFLGICEPNEAVLHSLTEQVNTTRKFGAPMSPEIRRRLAEGLLPKIEDAAQLLGGYAEHWLADARKTLEERQTER